MLRERDFVDSFNIEGMKYLADDALVCIIEVEDHFLLLP
jgi:hypothetical protein